MVTRFSVVYTGWLDTTDTPEIKLWGAYLSKRGFPVGMGIMIVVKMFVLSLLL